MTVKDRIELYFDGITEEEQQENDRLAKAIRHKRCMRLKHHVKKLTQTGN